VYNWLYDDGSLGHGYDVRGVAVVYGLEEVRTGCVGCPLASRDTALERLLRDNPQWRHLEPLVELKPLWRELKHARWRKRKAVPEMRKDGKWGKNVQRKGPLTMDGRAYGLEHVLDIQTRAGVELISAEEEDRIREMWAQDMWPRKWSAEDVDADVILPALSLTVDGRVAEQELLFGG
jgi:DNA sulfur modification protein DndC